MERWIPRRHEDISKIIEAAKEGNSFFVNRCALNGDLAGLPESQQRLIVATANDNAAAYTEGQIIPLTPEAVDLQQEFIAQKLDIAWRVFTGGEGKTVAEQIRELLNKE